MKFLKDERGEGGEMALVLVGGAIGLLLLLGATGGATLDAPTHNPIAQTQDRAWQRQEQVAAPAQQAVSNVPVTGIHAATVASSFSAYAEEMSRYGISVDVGDHAVERHGREAFLVREHFINKATVDDFFMNEPPCKDGRKRITSRIGKSWAVWVLVETEVVGVLREITAFMTDDSDYILRMRDDCGNKSWFGMSGSH